MDQQFPTDWPSLPKVVDYEKELSERFTTEAEPEYLISGKNDVRFMIREYEGGKKQITTYDLVDYSSHQISDEENFLSVLERLYTLLECDFLHSPPVRNVKYRGYHPKKETVWEYTEKNSITEKSADSFTALSFRTVDQSESLLENKGGRLAVVNIVQNASDNTNNTTTNTLSGQFVEPGLTCEFYENAAVHKKKDEVVEAYPIPEIALVVNTINNMLETNRAEVCYIDTSITSDVISTNI